MLTCGRQHHTAAPLLTKQPSLGTTLLASYGEWLSKGGLNKAVSYIAQLVNRGQQASFHAVGHQ